MTLEPIKVPDDAYLESIGFIWHTDDDSTPYITDEIVVIDSEEADAYYEAANELYDMFVEAGEHVIENELFHELGIPFNIVDAVKMSWDNDVHWHLYGRFDFAGGVDGKPIKLIEFNADTPTALFETSIVQWATLKLNGMEESHQFNNLHEALVDNFKRMITMDEEVESFEENYDGWKILFSSVKGNIEEENTVKLLQSIANEAGYVTEFAYVDEVQFDGEEGVFFNDENYEYWFKLLPWEDIAIEEADLAMLLTQIMENQKGIFLNPAYTLMFQSKAFMAILWDLYPNHPLLLETSLEPLQGIPQVEKRIFGREGANTTIVNAEEEVMAQTDGEYGEFPSVFQEYVELPTNDKGESYQAGVFYAYEGCGLGFRKGGLILDNASKFVGHRVVVEQL
ncbi:MAG: Similarity with glutathionylspermidine synthase (EC, group 2 [uncultured Sulfurovum sp.]|uniref:Similarity with glutathionylspermidine synthase (EC, group 2) n=1 Tax=uncultured Sulfurovum sp. TaxID=269237 RepID=A0A6S6SZ43_9BACT|nr:MAG: Similarity with glutathionylspermidine synthase (EC, group 2 [uncultured Sulfurovum sp.]